MVAAKRLHCPCSPPSVTGKDNSMTATAGLLLMNRIMPLIAAAIARGAVKPTGVEDGEELQAEGCALAAALLDSAESRGKQVTASNIAYYALQQLKSGRRTSGTGRTDVMAPTTQLDGHAVVESLDSPLEIVDEDGTGEMTLHDCIGSSGEDVDVAAGRRMDWEMVLPRLDKRRRGILTATAEGYGTKELAAGLGVSAARAHQVRESIGRYIVDAWGSNGIEDVATPSRWRAGLRAGAERRAGRAARASTT